MNDSQVTKDKLVSDFKAVVADTEELLKLTAGQAGDKGRRRGCASPTSWTSASNKPQDPGTLSPEDQGCRPRHRRPSTTTLEVRPVSPPVSASCWACWSTISAA